MPQGVSVTNAVAAGGGRCNSGRPSGTWLPRSSTAAQCASKCSPCPSDDEEWAHCPHPSTRLRARRQKEGDRFLLIVDNRKANALFAPPPCCPETDCRALKSIPVASPMENLLACTQFSTHLQRLPPGVHISVQRPMFQCSVFGMVDGSSCALSCMFYSSWFIIRWIFSSPVSP